ncbi:MAG TPA: cell surface protein, partial [Gemmataceae bacterium]|nr:cell surface protein [Gemmataceae bacterium]
MLKYLSRCSLLLLGATCLVQTAAAADLKVLPADITLTGPHASQRLLVAVVEGGAVVGDRTAQAQFTSANPAVAVVDGGAVRPVGDGETTITAMVDGKPATATVKVVRAKEAIDWSFRNHVIPMMTKIGCNSGACHGALAGKGGLKLALRAYAPSDDHFVLTRQVNGRRIDRIEPA